MQLLQLTTIPHALLGDYQYYNTQESQKDTSYPPSSPSRFDSHELQSDHERHIPL